jgi:hypothetical protein
VSTKPEKVHYGLAVSFRFFYSSRSGSPFGFAVWVRRSGSPFGFAVWVRRFWVRLFGSPFWFAFWFALWFAFLVRLFGSPFWFAVSRALATRNSDGLTTHAAHSRWLIESPGRMFGAELERSATQ